MYLPFANILYVIKWKIIEKVNLLNASKIKLNLLVKKALPPFSSRSRSNLRPSLQKSLWGQKNMRKIIKPIKNKIQQKMDQYRFAKRQTLKN